MSATMYGTISGKVPTLTWSVRDGARLVAIGTAPTVDAAIGVIIKRGADRNAIDFVSAKGVRRAV